MSLDFTQSSLQINPADPASSSLLMKPLAVSGGGSVHTGDSGGVGFATTSDPGYQAILAWIEAGEFE